MPNKDLNLKCYLIKYIVIMSVTQPAAEVEPSILVEREIPLWIGRTSFEYASWFEMVTFGICLIQPRPIIE